MYVQRLKDFDTYTPEGDPVLDTFAEVQQRWHLWRRRYDLFLRAAGTQRILSVADEPQPEPEPDMFHQFARIDDGLLAWHFTLRDGAGNALANVNRAFRGFGREVSCYYSVDVEGLGLIRSSDLHRHRPVFHQLQWRRAKRSGRARQTTDCDAKPHFG